MNIASMQLHTKLRTIVHKNRAVRTIVRVFVVVQGEWTIRRTLDAQLDTQFIPSFIHEGNALLGAM